MHCCRAWTRLTVNMCHMRLCFFCMVPSRSTKFRNPEYKCDGFPDCMPDAIDESEAVCGPDGPGRRRSRRRRQGHQFIYIFFPPFFSLIIFRSFDSLYFHISMHISMAVQCAAGAVEGDCIPCDGDAEYQDMEGLTQCKPTTPCTVGVTYEAVAATPSSNRVCSWARQCRGGEYEATPPTLTSNRACATLRQCDARKQ